MTTAGALDMAVSERAKLWLATDGDEVLGGVLGMPVQYYRRKSLSVLFVAGHSRERWEAPMLEAVERGARHIGCDLLEGIGRRGFGRILPGCRVIGYLFEKELTDGRS